MSGGCYGSGRLEGKPHHEVITDLESFVLL